MKILVLGNLNVDISIFLDKLPSAGETVPGRNYVVSGGGKAANQAVALAKLGFESFILAKICVDTLGALAVDRIKKTGINLDYLYQDSCYQTPVAAVLVDSTGENIIGTSPGANLHLTDEEVRKALVLDEAGWFLLNLGSNLSAIELYITYAATHGIPVVLDPAPLKFDINYLLPYVDIITPNQTELAFLVQAPILRIDDVCDGANKLLSAGVKIVIVKLGKKGAFLATRSGNVLVKSYNVNAIDTTGAGDAFNAGLVFGLSKGMNIEDSVMYGCAIGALTATRQGTWDAFPAVEEVINFLKIRKKI